jgi:hypothetical protein
MDEDDDVFANASRRRRPAVDHGRAILQLQRGFRADRAAGRQTEMADDDIRARTRHRCGIGFGEDIGRRQHVFFARLADHLDFERVAHAGIFEIGAERAVDQADGREILHAGETEAFEVVEKRLHQAERIGAVNSGEDGRVFDDGQHLARHFDDDLVGVAIGEEPGERAAPGHAVAPGIIDHDQVDAAGLLAFRRQTGPCPAANDRLAARKFRPEALQNLRPFYARHACLSLSVRAVSAISRKFLTSASANGRSLM